ncbi:MAG: 3,4-dihydroxy-2-butanone-4-phosphate synthase [Phycisphaerales bacterium]
MTIFSPIEEILADLRSGRMIVLVDDEQRENEGDLVCAGSCITPEIINFMTRHTPGYLCLAMTPDDCDRLDLHPQSGHNSSLRGTAMAVSIDGHPRHGVGTGISASDRARTVQIVCNPESRPDDLVRPGHMVPLRARRGGVLERTGQTEGSVDLMRLAGLHPAAVISEISRADGEMARMPELIEFCNQHQLHMCSVAQIIQHRLARERLIHRVDPVGGMPITTPYGTFNLIAYQGRTDPLPHLALTVGGIGDLNGQSRARRITDPVMVRMHRRDLLGDIFDESSNPSGIELRNSLRAIQREGRGALIYLRPEGIGTDFRDRLLSIQRPLRDDVNAPDFTRPSVEGAVDRHDIGIGIQILLDLGLERVRILTNHPKKLHGLSGYGLDVVEQLPIPLSE